MNMSPDQLLRESADVFRQKNEEYGDGFRTFGMVAKGLFPNGITLKTEEDFTRFGVFHHVMSKMHRYAQNFSKGGHDDSLADLSVYSAMLRSLDQEQQG